MKWQSKQKMKDGFKMFDWVNDRLGYVVGLLLLGAVLKTMMGCSPLLDATPGKDILVVFGKGSHQPVGNVRLRGDAFRVRFTPSCRYILQGDDQIDSNKLFGWGYLNSKGGHKANSARWGWYYEPTTDRIALVAYSYYHSKRNIDVVAYCRINDAPALRLAENGANYLYEVWVNDSYFKQQQPRDNRLQIRYYLGPYFGGNNPAPQQITLQYTPI